jgi:hypothetical protein
MRTASLPFPAAGPRINRWIGIVLYPVIAGGTHGGGFFSHGLPFSCDSAGLRASDLKRSGARRFSEAFDQNFQG